MSRLGIVLAPLLAGLVGSGCVHRSSAFVVPSAVTPAPEGPRLRVVSFNIKSGLESSISAVGDELAKLDPDVVALEEVDVGVKRTSREDQAKALAERLGMQFVFAGARERQGGDYGIALLSKRPILQVERIPLDAPLAFEPRVAIDATLDVNGRPVRVVALHADVLPWASPRNVAALTNHLRPISGPTLVMGDLNATPDSRSPRLLTELGLVDELHRHAEGPTFPMTGQRIDYVMADPELDRRVAGAGRGTSRVSDHVPVWVDFDVRWN